ncbi:putative ent-kaurene synthase [Helianthus debilis subsp. tardiflorus]
MHLIFFKMKLAYPNNSYLVKTQLHIHVPPSDLKGFLTGEPAAVSNAARLVYLSCRTHGFFQVINHGVDSRLIDEAHMIIDLFFAMPLSKKQMAQRKVGEYCGYASSFTNRFSSKLPWKETLSFRYSVDPQCSNVVQDYFLNVMGEDFSHFGYQNLHKLTSNYTNSCFLDIVNIVI